MLILGGSSYIGIVFSKKYFDRNCLATEYLEMIETVLKKRKNV